MNQSNLETVKAFLRAIEDNSLTDRIGEFYSPDVIHTEYPNAITRLTTHSNADQLRESTLRGQKVVSKQYIDIVKSYSFENAVIIEAVWIAILAVPIGNLPAGGEMRANFAQFFEFEDGKIIRQRNYDCFQPFS